MLYHLAHPAELLGIILGLVPALIAHNLAQVWALRVAGDRTALSAGLARISDMKVNRFIGPYAAVAAVLVGVGWPEPVPISGRFRRSERRSAGALVAGPVAVMLLALVWVFVAKAAGAHSVVVGSDTPGLTAAAALTGSTGTRIALYAAGAAASLAVLTALPIPPLTGGRILFLLAPRTGGWERARLRLVESPVGSYIALAILLGPLLLPGLPRIVPDLATPLLGALLRAAGVAALLP